MISLLLFAAAADPSCGKTVVSANQPVLPLYENGRLVVQLKVKDNALPAPLPVVACSPTMVLVRHNDQLLRADRWQVVFAQELDTGPCDATSAGTRANTSSASVMNGLASLQCDARSAAARRKARQAAAGVAPAPTPTPARKGKR